MRTKLGQYLMKKILNVYINVYVPKIEIKNS